MSLSEGLAKGVGCLALPFLFSMIVAMIIIGAIGGISELATGYTISPSFEKVLTYIGISLLCGVICGVIIYILYNRMGFAIVWGILYPFLFIGYFLWLIGKTVVEKIQEKIGNN